MMSEDEERTLKLLRKARGFVDPTIMEFDGRIANTAGDSVIAVFPAASKAILCAIKIQKRLRKANKDLEPRKRLILRIGLNLGEIYSEGKDVLGEGVNIAARLESQAEPGSICMSEDIFNLTYKTIEKENILVSDLGNLELKNISVPIRAYEILSSKSGYDSALAKSIPQRKKIWKYFLVFLIAFGTLSLALGIVYMIYINFLSVKYISILE
jgi:adenylate cyclase